ncbi:MAG: cytochrome bc1 complex cytochrome b subunit [Acidobacteriaceae bacterium]
MMKRTSRWLDERLHLAKSAQHALNHVFPDHWSFMLGEIALYSFVVLVITGTFMAMFFDPSSAKVIYHGPIHELDGVQVSAAYQSVLHLSFGVPAGLLIRQMHHWAALIFIGAIVAHMARIFFTAAYRRPREINWFIGLTLLLLALANGFFGYSIADDLLSGAGVRIGYSMTLSIPIIGPWVAFLLFGATVPADVTIPRFYALHIFLVPALIAGLLALHLGIIWRQYHTNFPGPRRSNHQITGARVWPTYTAKSIGLFFLVFAVIAALGGLVQIDPVWIYGPYSTAAIIPGAQPDWYLGWVEGAMRLFPGVNLHIGEYLIPGVFFPGVLFPALVFLALYLYPFFDKAISRDTQPHNVLRLPYEQPFHTALGCTVFVFMLVLLFAASDDVIAVAVGGSVTQIRLIFRIIVFVAPAITGAIVYPLCLRVKRKHELAETMVRVEQPGEQGIEKEEMSSRRPDPGSEPSPI